MIDDIVKEPLGGAHRQPEIAIQEAGDMIGRMLDAFAGVSSDVLRTQRREKFLSIGRSA